LSANWQKNGMVDLVSVIVPTYNNFDNLERNIESIYLQDYPRIEILVADDGSVDFPIGRFSKIVAKKPSSIVNFVCLRQPLNLGTVRNLNLAIEESSGEFILPLFQDDTFFNECVVSKVVALLQSHLVVTAKRVIEAESGDCLELPTLVQRKWMLEGGLYNKILWNENFISGAVLYYRREAFAVFGPFDQSYRLLEDFPFVLKVVRQGLHIGFLDWPAIYYNVGGISSSLTKGSVLLNDLILLYKREAFLNRGLSRRRLLFVSKIYESVNRGGFGIFGDLPVKLSFFDIWLLTRIKRFLNSFRAD